MNHTDLQHQIQERLYLQFDYRVMHWTPVAGSSLNDCFQLTLQDNRVLFVKLNDKAPADFYAAEQHNLAQLAATEVVNVPTVIDCSEQALVMEWIPHGPPSDSAQFILGQQLARMHRQPVTDFGFEQDNYCGLSAQHNAPMDDGFAFFAEQRLMAQGLRALAKDYLTRREMRQLELLSQRLREWIPEQAPALLHGDLWAGNFVVDSQDQPWLIDPACYRGWPEAELAMTKMFGGFSDAFYRGYASEQAIDSTLDERLDLYNLYHWLNHLNMFGSQYHSAVTSIIHRYAGP